MPHGVVDSAVDAEGQGVAGCGDLVAYRVKAIRAPPDDVQDRAEHLALEPAGAVDLEGARREEGAMLGVGRPRTLVEKTTLPRHPGGMPFERLAGRLVDHRADIGGEQRRIADRELGHRACQHRQQPVGDVVLDIEEAHGRAALPGAVEGGDQDVGDDLFRARPRNRRSSRSARRSRRSKARSGRAAPPGSD